MEFEKYRNLRKNNWPDFEIYWNLKLEDSIYDNIYSIEFFPRGFLIGLVSLNELMDNMQSFNQERLKEEVPVKELNDHKIAKIIHSCVENKEILPPYITECSGAFSIKNGWHRLRICLVKNEHKIPIFVSKDEKEIFDKKIDSIEWL